ncbi:hypothetical protein GEMRC1_011040 [Eukaryota sp. GEM-RC1]
MPGSFSDSDSDDDTTSIFANVAHPEDRNPKLHHFIDPDLADNTTVDLWCLSRFCDTLRFAIRHMRSSTAETLDTHVYHIQCTLLDDRYKDPPRSLPSFLSQKVGNFNCFSDTSREDYILGINSNI